MVYSVNHGSSNHSFNTINEVVQTKGAKCGKARPGPSNFCKQIKYGIHSNFVQVVVMVLVGNKLETSKNPEL